MLVDYLLLALLGCFIGIFTGLIPGFHVNTVALIGLGLYLSMGWDPIDFAVVLTALSITHSFLDFLPSIFLGAPEEDTAFSVLPAHQLFMNGRSLEAVKLTAVGSLLGLGISLALLIPAFYIIPFIYNLSRGFIAYILIVAVLFMILRERTEYGIKLAVVVLLLSGWMGFVALRHQNVISSTEVLFPVFAGLFGLSNLVYALRAKAPAIPQERHVRVGVEKRFIGSGFLGALSGALIGVLPAISPSQMAAVVSEVIALDMRNFLVFVSAINTADAIYSILALYTINNARSGVAVMVGKVLDVNLNIVLLLVGVMAFTAFFATFLHIQLGKRMAAVVGRINYRALSLISLAIVLLLVFLFTGFFGLFLAGLCTVVGLLPILSGVSRTHLMGVLLLPSIMYFLGF